MRGVQGSSEGSKEVNTHYQCNVVTLVIKLCNYVHMLSNTSVLADRKCCCAMVQNNLNIWKRPSYLAKCKQNISSKFCTAAKARNHSVMGGWVTDVGTRVGMREPMCEVEAEIEGG